MIGSSRLRPSMCEGDARTPVLQQETARVEIIICRMTGQDTDYMQTCRVGGKSEPAGLRWSIVISAYHYRFLQLISEGVRVLCEWLMGMHTCIC